MRRTFIATPGRGSGFDLIKRNYGKKSSIDPLTYKNGVALISVHAKEDRFKWSTIHFFRMGDKVRISVVPRRGALTSRRR